MFPFHSWSAVNDVKLLFLSLTKTQNKLERLSPSSFSSLINITCIIKLIAAVIYGFLNKLECLSLNIILGWKGLPGTNTLAYCGNHKLVLWYRPLEPNLLNGKASFTQRHWTLKNSMCAKNITIIGVIAMAFSIPVLSAVMLSVACLRVAIVSMLCWVSL